VELCVLVPSWQKFLFHMKYYKYYILSFGIIILDQVVKMLVHFSMDLGPILLHGPKTDNISDLVFKKLGVTPPASGSK